MDSAEEKVTQEVDRLRWTRGFLREAVAARVLDAGTFARLDAELTRREALRVRETVATPSSAPTPPTSTEPTGSPSVPRPPVPPSVPRPSVAGRPSWAASAPRTPSRWSVLRERIAADVAVHGTAYLGVLLVLAAVLGFAMFSVGQLPPVAQPAVLATIPAAGFGAAALLRRRGAPFVAAGVELVAGIALPVVAMSATSALIDGEAARVGSWTAVCALSAGGYALAVRRDPRTVLRHLVVPAAALALAVASLAATGEVGPVQPAVAAVVGTVALAVGSRRGERAAWGPLGVGAATTVALGVPLALVAALLGLDAAAVSAVALSAVATAVSVVVVRDRLPEHPLVVPIVHLGALTVTALYAAAVFDAAWVGAATSAGALGVAATAHRWGERTRAWDWMAATVLVVGLLAAAGQTATGVAAAVLVGTVGHLALARNPRTAWRPLELAGGIAAPLVLVDVAARGWGVPTGLAVAVSIVVAIAAAARTRWGTFAEPALPWAAALLGVGNLLRYVDTWSSRAVDPATLRWHVVAAAVALVALASARAWPPVSRVGVGLVLLGALQAVTGTLLALPGRWVPAATAGTATAVAMSAASVLGRGRGDGDGGIVAAARLAWWASCGVLVVLLVVSAPAAQGRWSPPLAAVALLAAAVWLLGHVLALLRPAAISVAWWVAAGFALPLLVAVRPGVVTVAPGALVWTGLALLPCGLGARRRDAAVAAVGTVLVLAGTAYTPWALALALVATAVAWSAVAVRVAGTPDRSRWKLAALGAATAGVAAVPVAVHALVRAELLEAPDGRVAALVCLGAVAAAAAVVTRHGRSADAAVADRWVLVASLGVAAATMVLYAAPGRPTALPAVLGVLLAAAALGGSAASSGQAWRRAAAAAGGVLALVMAQDLARVTPGSATAQLAAAGAGLVLLGILAARGAAACRPWAGPALGAAAALGVLACFAAPTRLALAGVLVVAAAALFGIAAGLGRRGAVAAAVALLALAWGVAHPTLLADVTARAVWVALPFALALFIECELGRAAARRGAAIDPTLIAMGEWAALAIALLPALSAQVIESAAYSLVGVGLAVALLAWALATRVRRRLALATTAAVLPLALLLGIPLLAVIPAFGGLWLWVALGLIGVLLVGAATGMERGRRGVRTALGRLDDSLVGWE